ncbi:MAG TPA: FAD-dependent oxidoreductase [Stellaceae bacterium]|nr:FAD-dependent oxidoreductase [Stellaceae bacterium]
MPLAIAIVGAGPAGCYAAERLARAAPDAAIDVIERLPTPYGLVRAGVAPDHQGTKAVERVLERALTRPGVAFFGNVEIGRDLSLAELKGLYDAVIVATGAPEDRRLGITGEELAGVFGSGAFTRWINGHPDAADLPVRLEHVRSAVVIGNGNVAIDVARVLAKSREEMAGSDLAPSIAEEIAAAPLQEIHIVGRRGPAEAHFTPLELEELGSLARATPVVNAAALPEAPSAGNPRVLEILRGFAGASDPSKPIRLHFDFELKPLRFEGGAHVERAVFERQRPSGGSYLSTGETTSFPADLVVSCIGYRSLSCGGLAPEEGKFRNEDGRIEPGLYVVGWAKRGPSGTIPTNRSEAHAVADRVLAETRAGDKRGRAGLTAALSALTRGIVDFPAWRAIDAAERARASTGRPREKLRRWSDFATPMR